MELDIGGNLYHLKGFEVTRKIVLEGDHNELPDMLHELADLLVELDLNHDDRINGNIMVTRTNDGKTKVTTSLQSAPKK